MHKLSTPLTRKLKIRYPILQAPFPDGITTPSMVAAVSDNGAMGTLYGSHLTPVALADHISEIQSLTRRPFAVHFDLSTHIAIETPELIGEQLQEYRTLLQLPATPARIPLSELVTVALTNNVPVFGFSGGQPDPDTLATLKSEGITVMAAASHLLEAIVLEEIGVDIVIAQGIETAGPRTTFIGNRHQGTIGTMALTPLISDTLNIPVVAAGGILDGRSIAAALTLGADGVQIGTGFLSCMESGISESHRQKLQQATEIGTVISRAVTGKPARCLKNQLVNELEEMLSLEESATLSGDITRDIRLAANQQNKEPFQGLWAGQGCSPSQEKPVAELIQEWMAQVKNITGWQ